MIKQIRLIYLLIFVGIALAASSISMNYWRFHFSGNNYYPDDSFKISILLVLLYLAAYVQWSNISKITQVLKLTVAYYGILAILALFTNAAQYTPFTPIDHTIITHWEFLDTLPFVAWTKHHSALRHILAFLYNSLSYEMIIVPILLTVTLKRNYLYEYYILLLATAIIGFSFYYFYPSSGPASIFDPSYFVPAQLATGIKFAEIHNKIPPSTLEGGLIAFPSFHVIWSWLCVYGARPFRRLYRVLLPYNLLIVASCVLLGWHYFIDIFGSIMVLILAHGFCIMHRTTAKRCEPSSKDHTRVQQISIFNNPVT